MKLRQTLVALTLESSVKGDISTFHVSTLQQFFLATVSPVIQGVAFCSASLRRRSLLGAVPGSSALPALGEEPHFTRLQLTRSVKVMSDLNLFSSDFSELWDQK